MPAEFGGEIVCAIPYPHIERWHLLDPGPLVRLGLRPASLPRRVKCEKGVCKRLLREAFLSGGIDPLLGGVEYGGRLAGEVDLDRLGHADRNFNHFATAFRAAVRRLA